MNFGHGISRPTALASLTATYTDSEGDSDSDVEKDLDKEKQLVTEENNSDRSSNVENNSDVGKGSDIEKPSNIDWGIDKVKDFDSDAERSLDSEKNSDDMRNSSIGKDFESEDDEKSDKSSDMEENSYTEKNSYAKKSPDIVKNFNVENNSELTKLFNIGTTSDIEIDEHDHEATNSAESPMSSSASLEENFHENKYLSGEKAHMSKLVSYSEDKVEGDLDGKEKFYEEKYPLREKVQMSKLVSYSEDKIEGGEVSDSDESRSSDYDMHDDSADSPNIGAQNPALSPRSFHQSLRNLKKSEIRLPPEPIGRCSNSLQEKIVDLYEKKKLGKDMSASLQQKKNFRNPSIYEKLIQFCSIDERGTNYPPEIYDPHAWGPESFYEELAKRQKEEMDKREKEKKERTKVEFISGTVKKPISETVSEIGKRKSKWDVGITNLSTSTLKPAQLITPTVLPVATGTKPTVISAFGTITKKPKQ